MSWKIAPIGRGGDLLYSQAGTPSLDLRFAEKKALTDYVSGDNLVTFSRSSNATYVDSNGVIQTATTDTPRFDHNPTTGESLGLLIEESRTNILLNSATLSTQSVTTSATAYTLSFYGTGTVTLSGTSTAGPLVGTGANDRVTLTFTPTAGTLTLTVTGTVSNAQLEAGSFPTSYIPTSGATATRAADVVQITGTNFSSWYNQSEGTVFIDRTQYTDSTGHSYYFSDSGLTANRVRLQLVTHSGNNADASFYAIAASGNKSALAVKTNDVAVSAGGSSVLFDTTFTLAPMDRLFIGKHPTVVSELNGHISRLTYWPQRLPDATLQTITT